MTSSFDEDIGTGNTAFVTAESKRGSDPRRHLLIVAAAVFFGEALIMLLMPLLPPMALWTEVLLDAILVTLAVLPLLDRFLLRPLRAEIAERMRAEEALRTEVEVRRLAETELAQSNQKLRALTEAERRARKMAEALASATVALNSSLDLDEVLDRMLEQTQRVVPCRALAVLLIKGEWVQIARHRDQLGLWQPISGFPIARFPKLRDLAASSWARLISDVELDEQWMVALGLEWVRSLVLAPMVEEGRTVGFLVTLSERPGYFRSGTIGFLMTFAAYAALALHHADVYQSELRARKAVETLAATSLALTQTLEMEAVLQLLLVYLRRLIPYGSGWIMLLDSESRLVVCAQAHHDTASEVGTRLPLAFDLADNPQLQNLLVMQQGVLAQNREEAPAWTSNLASGDKQSWLVMPIVAGGRALGLCSLEKDEPGFFTPEHMHLAEAVASQAAVAVQNAWLFQQLRAGRERLQALSHRLVQVQENERLYVARELHDEAGQALAALTLGLGQLERDARDPTKVVEEVHALQQVANDVQESLHRLAMDLRPASLDHLGLASALGAFVEKLRRQCPAALQFKLVGWSEEREAPVVEVSLYRIAQEAITNAVRHAQAGNISILLQRNDHSVMLTVEDNGIGFDPEETTSSDRIGLLGMRERCEMLGGSLVVESKAGAGTTVVAEVPHANSNPDL